MTMTYTLRRESLRASALRQLTMMANCTYQHPMMDYSELRWLSILFDVPEDVGARVDDDTLISLIMHQITHRAFARWPVYVDLPAVVIRRMLADPRLGEKLRDLHDCMCNLFVIAEPDAADTSRPQDMITVYFNGSVCGCFPTVDDAEQYRDMMIYSHIFNGL